MALLPTTNTFLNQDLETVEQTSRTFYLDMDNNIVFGYTDGTQAMKQAIYLILNIERYKYVIFPWSYGIELEDLFGQPISFVLPEIKRRVTEALIHDTRITSVDNFNFTVGKGVVTATFTAHTIFGDIEIERAVTV
jgi:hypothetical protein